MSTEEKIILFEYEMYSEKEYKPMSYAEFVTKKLIEAREELSKSHQPTVSVSVKATKDKFGDELKCICNGTHAYHCPKCGLP